MTKRSKSNQFQSRIMLLTVLGTLVAAGPALSQNTTSNAASGNAAARVSEGGYSLVDVSAYFGTQWFQIYQGSTGGNHFFEARPIFGESVTFNFSKYVGIEERFGLAYNRLGLTPAGFNNYVTTGSTNTQLDLLGVVSFTPRDSMIRPFAYAGPGVIIFDRRGGLQLPSNAPPILLQGANFSTQAYADLTYGVGTIVNLNKKFAMRFDVTGVWTPKTAGFGLPNIPAGPGYLYIVHNHGESALQFTIGFVFRLGYVEPPAPPAPPPPPPPPPAPKPVANITVGTIQGAHDVCPGDNLRLTVTASGWLPDQTPNYQWTINNQAAPGATGAAFNLPTTDPGAKAVRVTVSAGGSTATAGPVNVVVRPLAPPTIRFAVSPTTIAYGDRLPLNATATAGNDCGGAVTVRYTASEGTIAGNNYDSSGVAFDMTNRLKQQSKMVHLTAIATDAKNQTANAGADITVTLKPEARRLDDIVFQQRSSRVNNCGKRLLIDVVTPMLRDDPDAKVVLIGHQDMGEQKGVDEQRTLNAAAILSAGKGICPSLDLSRVLVNWVGTDQTDATRPALCGSSTNVKERSGQAVRENDQRAQFRRVEIWVIPGGADMPANLTGLKPAPEKEIKAKGCPR